MLAERAARMEGAEQTAVLEQRHRAVDEPFEIAPRLGGREMEAVHGAGAVPAGDQVGEIDGAAAVVRSGVAGRRARRALQTGFHRAFAVAEIDGERGQHPQGAGVTAVVGGP